MTAKDANVKQLSHPKKTTAELIKYILDRIPLDYVMTLKRFKKSVGEMPRNRFTNIIVDEDELILEDVYGELVVLPLDSSKPTTFVQITDEGKYAVAVPLLDYLSLHFVSHTDARYAKLGKT